MSLGIARVTATNTLDGHWTLNVNVPLGRRYIADLATVHTAQFATPQGQAYFTQVVQVFKGGRNYMPGNLWGFFPLEMLKLEAIPSDSNEHPFIVLDSPHTFGFEK